MNLARLRTAEALFLQRYPGGFDNEEMQAIGKKHKVDKVSELAATVLAKKNFVNQAQVIDDLVKIVSRSSMVSLFEKPKFRDYVNGLNRDDRGYLADGFRKLLHGNAKSKGKGSRKEGFEDVVDVLTEGKLAKWSLLTIVPFYFRPQTEVFVKPTTTKNAIRQFELTHLTYHPRPTWDFYVGYREAIEQMKAKVHPSLAPNNAAFTGFLMITSEGSK